MVSHYDTQSHFLLPPKWLESGAGDLYQIAEKFEQRNAPPSKIIDTLPNDDDYYFYNKKHRSAGKDSSGRAGTNQHRRRMEGTNRKEDEDPEGKRWNRQAFLASQGQDVEQSSRRLSWFGWGSSNSKQKKSSRKNGANGEQSLPEMALGGVIDSVMSALNSSPAVVEENDNTSPATTVAQEDNQDNDDDKMWVDEEEGDGSMGGKEGHAISQQRWFANLNGGYVFAGLLGEGIHKKRRRHRRAKMMKRSKQFGGSNDEQSLGNGKGMGSAAAGDRVEGDMAARKLRVGPYESSLPEHCSAIIKILPNNADVVFGHNTWDDFQCAAPRIFKHYTFNYMTR